MKNKPKKIIITLSLLAIAIALAISVSSATNYLKLTNTNLSFGTDRLFIDETNARIGISTTSPNNKLDVNGTITTNDGFDSRYGYFANKSGKSPAYVEEGELMFLCHFDGTTDCYGLGEPTFHNTTFITNGKFGGAMNASITTETMYTTPSGFNRSKGTLMLWAQHYGGKNAQEWFEIQDANNGIMIYNYNTAGNMNLYFMGYLRQNLHCTDQKKRWHHIAVIWDVADVGTETGSLRMYCDGILKFAVNDTWTNNATNFGGSITFGEDSNGNNNNVTIDEVLLIHNRDLTEEEILRDYRAGRAHHPSAPNYRYIHIDDNENIEGYGSFSLINGSQEMRNESKPLFTQGARWFVANDTNQRVGIGTDNPVNKLTVDGDINATGSIYKDGVTELDFVFDIFFDGKVKEEDKINAKDYYRVPLEELEPYLKENRHLARFPGAKLASPYEIGSIDELLMEKVEEAHIYIIEQQRQINQIKQIICKDHPKEEICS